MSLVDVAEGILCPVCDLAWSDCTCVNWAAMDEWLDDLKFGMDELMEDEYRD